MSLLDIASYLIYEFKWMVKIWKRIQFILQGIISRLFKYPILNGKILTFQDESSEHCSPEIIHFSAKYKTISKYQK